MIHLGDCLEVMAGMEPESVDAIVTDPPYDLTDIGRTLQMAGNRRHSKGFMGKSWDGTRIAFEKATWEAAYRVAKPSAYLLAFGGTRTVHRMTCALEDAGWIIRDMLVWAYASGFPKSKASLKPAWEPIVMARKPGPLRMLAVDACRIGWGADTPTQEEWNRAGSSGKPGANGYAGQFSKGMKDAYAEGKIPVPSGRWPANVILTDPIFDGGIEGVVGGGAQESPAPYTRGTDGPKMFEGGWDAWTPAENNYGDSGTYSRFFQLPQRYNGPCPNCGLASTAEPRSYPSNQSDGFAPSHAQTGAWSDATTTTDSPTTSGIEPPSSSGESASTSRTRPSPGRRRSGLSLSSDPANNAARLETSSATTTTTISRWSCDSCVDAAMRSSTDEPGFAEQPDSPRWFLIPKADRSDREPVLGGPTKVRAILGQGIGGTDNLGVARANTHPTVKPTDLMRHLVRLVTPTGGTVLDPFLGSGTTALAAEMEGFGWIGIEREAEYVQIAEARLNGIQRGLGLPA